jgi:hypothetical protein
MPEPLNIPALRQSLCETASCPHSYGYQVIEGHKMPSGLQSARGTEIHHVMSEYIRHCAKKKVPADWAKFDELAYGAGSEAAGILNGLRDNYIVDFEHVYDTELTLSYTHEFPDGFLLETEGILDGLFFLTPANARIDDFKSHPRPFDPDTFQSKLYPFMVLMNFPEVEEVSFQLIFVRYANARRSVTYTRDDLPMLRQEIVNARARQIRMHKDHAAGITLEAYPGSHCAYCPLLQGNQCPIAEFNPHATLSLEERLRFAVWIDEVNAVNKQVLKDAVDASGQPVTYRDGNNRLVQIGFNEREAVEFPLVTVYPFLKMHAETYPADTEWIKKLNISSTKLKSALKAKKRAITHQAIMDTAAVRLSKTTFAITTPAESDENPRKNEWEEE